MDSVFLRTPYNYDRDAASEESGLRCQDVSLAQQHMKDDCDINVIVERFGLTGKMPLEARIPLQGDFSDVGDYRSAIDRVRAAEAGFMALPADVRSLFNNDPGRFEAFAVDPANRPVLEKAGLLVKRETPMRVSHVVEAIKEGFASLAPKAPV